MTVSQTIGSAKYWWIPVQKFGVNKFSIKLIL